MIRVICRLPPEPYRPPDGGSGAPQAGATSPGGLPRRVPSCSHAQGPALGTLKAGHPLEGMST